MTGDLRGRFSEVTIDRDFLLSSRSDVRLFLVDMDEAGEIPTSARLSNEEYARLEKLRDPVLRHRFVVRRILLRRLISAECGISACDVEYRYSRYGKPEVADLADSPRFHFNTSTSEGWHAIATSRAGPVGVDIEAIGRQIDYTQVLRVAASAEELSWHSDARAGASRLLAMKIWVAKEAILKAAGRGLSVNPRAISLPRDLVVSKNPNTWTRVSVADLEESFWVRIIMDEHIVLALARPGATQ